MMSEEEALMFIIANAMNSIEMNDDYAIGTADGTVTLFKAISDDERTPFVELIYNDEDEWEAVYV